MKERIEVKTDWCEHCGQRIARYPFQPDPAASEWVWSWVHHNTGQTACEGLYAEPLRVKAAVSA